MKNLFKNTLVVLAVSASLVACKGSGSSKGGDTAKADSSVSTVADTTVKVDSLKKDTTAAADTSKKVADTVSKKVTVKTTEKKDVTKKQ
jgi:outer membrane murein-binding lipoprotein Lpp